MKNLIIPFLYLLACTSCNDGASTQEKSKTTSEETTAKVNSSQIDNKDKNDDFPISIDYPEDWRLTQDAQLNALILQSPTDELDQFQEMISIFEGGTSGKELDAFFEGNLKAIQGMFDELVETEKPAYQTINGVQFKKVRYNYLLEGLPLTAQIYVTIKNDKSYIINCSALQNTFDEYQDQFTKVINSIKLN